MSDYIKNIFRTTGVLEEFQVFDTAQQAAKSFGVSKAGHEPAAGAVRCGVRNAECGRRRATEMSAPGLRTSRNPSH